MLASRIASGGRSAADRVDGRVARIATPIGRVRSARDHVGGRHVGGRPSRASPASEPSRASCPSRDSGGKSPGPASMATSPEASRRSVDPSVGDASFPPLHATLPATIVTAHSIRTWRTMPSSTDSARRLNPLRWGDAISIDARAGVGDGASSVLPAWAAAAGRRRRRRQPRRRRGRGRRAAARRRPAAGPGSTSPAWAATTAAAPASPSTRAGGRRRRRAVRLLHGRRRLLGRLDLLRPEHRRARPVRARRSGTRAARPSSRTRSTARAPPTRSATRATSSSPTAPATCTRAATSRPTTCSARARSRTSAAATSRRCCPACAPPGRRPRACDLRQQRRRLRRDAELRSRSAARTPTPQVALVDDAGPLLEGDGIPADHRAAWYANWHLGDVVDPLCADCRADLSRLYPALVAKYPQDRMALLTSLQDSGHPHVLPDPARPRLRAAPPRAGHRPPRPDRDLPHLRHPRRVAHAARRGRHDHLGGLTLEAWLGADADRRPELGDRRVLDRGSLSR